MSAATIIKQAAAAGVKLALSRTGTIKATGDKEVIARWATMIRNHKPGIVVILHQSAHEARLALDIFATELTADPEIHRSWTVAIPPRDPIPVIICPDATAEQMRAMYPTATSIEPAADTS